MSTTVSSVDVATIAAGLAAVSVPWDLGVDTPPSSRRYERIPSPRTPTDRVAHLLARRHEHWGARPR